MREIKKRDRGERSRFDEQFAHEMGLRGELTSARHPPSRAGVNMSAGGVLHE